MLRRLKDIKNAILVWAKSRILQDFFQKLFIEPYVLREKRLLENKHRLSSNNRNRYVAAMKAADKQDYSRLEDLIAKALRESLEKL